MSSEDKGFEVRDRRIREESRSGEPPPSSGGGASDPRPTSGMPPYRKGPVGFSDFIFSLSTSALMMLGEEPDPGAGERAVDLDKASELIDLISLLEEKTRGNLTSDESNFLSKVLYMLRMKFVETAKRHPRQPKD